jgi:hypothetical protein
MMVPKIYLYSRPQNTDIIVFWLIHVAGIRSGYIIILQNTGGMQ